jgi:hypothetical protein
MVESLLSGQMLAVLMLDACSGQTSVTMSNEPGHCLVIFLLNSNIKSGPEYGNISKASSSRMESFTAL